MLRYRIVDTNPQAVIYTSKRASIFGGSKHHRFEFGIVSTDCQFGADILHRCSRLRVVTHIVVSDRLKISRPSYLTSDPLEMSTTMTPDLGIDLLEHLGGQPLRFRPELFDQRNDAIIYGTILELNDLWLRVLGAQVGHDNIADVDRRRDVRHKSNGVRVLVDVVYKKPSRPADGADFRL